MAGIERRGILPPQTMARLENAYHLYVTSLGADAAGCDRLRVVLAAEHDRWENLDPAAAVPVSSALLDRCCWLQRHPEDVIELMAEGGDMLRDPDPTLVDADLVRATPDDIGAWLWTKLPAVVREPLERTLHNTTRLVVHAPGDASLLPWHRLAAWHQGAAHQPHARDRWDVWIHVEGGTAEDVRDVQPRVLLLVGSQRQRPEAQAAEHDVVAIARSISAAGFFCEVAAGTATVQAIGDEARLWHRLETLGNVTTLVAGGDYDVVHFVGHSDATRSADSERLGATHVEFEFHDPDEPRRLPIIALANALRGKVGVVVLHACTTRERVAAALLQPSSEHPSGAVHAVVTMGAIAPPPACAAFAAGFYRAWHAEQPWLDAAVAEGRRSIRTQHPGLDWLPMLWTRTGERLRLADREEQLVAQYCFGVRLRHSRFEGLFGKHFDALFEKVAVDVEVTREREAGADLRSQRLLPRPRLAAATEPGLQVADLVLPGRWYTLGGPAGSGKTTMLRRLACSLARDRQRAFVPVYLPLGEWLRAMPDDAADFAQAIGAFVERSHKVQGLGPVLASRARRGGVALLLDGVDELSPELRGKFLGLLEQVLRRDHAACPTLVATRRYETSKHLPQAWFGDADLLPLAIARAKELLTNILGSCRRTEATSAAQADQLATARVHADWLGEEVAKGNRLWQEVASTPLLVSLLALQLLHGEAPATSRLQFFAQTLRVLCLGSHRARSPDGEACGLPHADDALRVLRYLAWRLTVARVRTTTRAELCAWLVPDASVGAAAGITALAPPADVLAALGEREKWRLPVDDAADDDPFRAQEADTAAGAFLHAVARLTVILTPQDTGDRAPWQFWHKSFQEALCALYLRERFLSVSRDAAAVAAMLSAFDGWIVGGSGGSGENFALDDAAVARWRAELLPLFAQPNERGGLTPAQAEIDTEAYSAPTDDPSQRNVRLNRAWEDYVRRPNSWAAYASVVVDVVAAARAGAEAREAFVEAFGLLSDALEDPQSLVDGLLRRDRQLALRVALAAREVPPGSLVSLLRALLELGERAALVERAAARCPAAQAMAMHVAMCERVTDLALVVRPRRRAADRGNTRIEVWGAPGELGVLHRAAGTFGPAEVRAQTRASVLQAFPTCAVDVLRHHLHLVPDREKEHESGRSEAGIRLWRLVPSGEFEMGSPDGGPRGDEVKHAVRIAQPFWISAVPVTVGLYRLFSPAHEVWIGEEGYRRVDDRDLDPTTAVSGVSHHAARMFCIWLQHHAGPELLRIVRAQAQEAGVPVPKAIEVRLPWEAEWEYAARGCTTRGSTTRYFFGDDPTGEELQHWGWFGEGPRAGARPVATKRGRPSVVPEAPAEGANAFGLFDVHGNVWEWCEDWYAERYSMPKDGVREDVRGPTSGRFRVLRGGSVGNGADYCRAAARNWNEPDGSGSFSGFRVVLAAVPRSVIDG